MLLALLSLLASADVLRAYDLTKFTGTCTPVMVRADIQVQRMVVGTAFTDATGHRYGTAAVKDRIRKMEVCFPDEVGRNGVEPTYLTVYFDANGGLQTTVDWTRDVVHYTTLGLVKVNIGQSRPITPAKK